MARDWTDVFHTGARCSRMGGDAHSHLRDAEIYRDIAAHFTEKEMVDLTIAIGLMNVFNRIAIGFGCDPAPHDMRSST